MTWPKSADINLIRSFTSRTASSGQILAEDVVDPSTGEIIAEAGTKIDTELAVPPCRTPLFRIVYDTRLRSATIKVLVQP